jgi:hypothetical protein
MSSNSKVQLERMLRQTDSLSRLVDIENTMNSSSGRLEEGRKS